MKPAAKYFHYYRGLADKIQGAVTPIDRPKVFNYTRYEPVGMVATITPWASSRYPWRSTRSAWIPASAGMTE